MSSRNNLFFIAPLAFLSGLAHGIIISATAWWLKSLGVSYTTIGIFNICNWAYGFTIFWVPLFDQINLSKLFSKIGIRFNVPIQRKGFIILCVVSGSICIYIASLADPKVNIMALGIPIAFAAFWFASADAIMIAYTYETLQPKDMGMSTAGYRLGHFAASNLTLFLYEMTGLKWPVMLKIASVLIIILVSSLFMAPQEKEAKIRTWRESCILPYQDLISTYKYYLIVIILFIAIYKAQDRFVAPMESLFLRTECSLDGVGYFILKLVSTFALAFSAIKSGPLLSRFGYKGAFSMSIVGNALIALCYFLHTLKVNIMYIICVIIIGAVFGFFYYTVTKQKRFIYSFFFLALPIIFIPHLNNLFIINLASISAFGIVIIAKMTSGIRSSLLYTYQNSLCSKEYALTQITLVMTLERLILGNVMQVMSGYCVDRFSWSGFYLISILIALLPLLLINLTRYPKIKA